MLSAWSGVAWLAVLCAGPVMAGGGPQNLLLVVNDQSQESLWLGQVYRQLRDIPERNVCHIAVDPFAHDLSNASFQTTVVDRVRQHIADHGLSQQIDYILLSKDIPSRVNNNEGATAVLFYGFKNAPLIGPCSMPSNTYSYYFRAERALHHRDTYAGTNYYISMMLTASNFVEAISNVTIGAMADATAPAGTFYLLKPWGDPARNIRYQRFDNFDFHWRFKPNFPDYEYVPDNVAAGRTNVMGYMTGLPGYPDWVYRTNVFLPGAMADHLTSYGGRLPVAPLGQDNLWEWIRAGASASYGTVNEPCAYLEKFPDPMCFFWLARGFTVGESYWMSVANPYQGLFAGDPLAAPYAFPPTLAITSPAPGSVVSGVATLEYALASGAAGHRVAGADVYVDDRFFTNAILAAPSPGNLVDITINTVTTRYAAQTGETLYSMVAAVANTLTTSALPVNAVGFGDRILLVDTNLGQIGSGITYAAAAFAGTAAVLNLSVEALTSNLLDCIYPARELIALLGTAESNDQVDCLITLTNGVRETNTVIAADGETASDVMTRIGQLMNSNTVLRTTGGVFITDYQLYGDYSEAWLQARSPGPQGYNLFVDFLVTPATPGMGLSNVVSFSDHFNDNLEVLTARGTLLFEQGQPALSGSFVWDTGAVPNGPHRITLAAFDGTGAEVQGRAHLDVVVSNLSLACNLAAPTNGSVVQLGDVVSVEAEASGSSGVTQLVFLIEGKPTAPFTSAPATSSWSTLSYGVGSVSVQAEARDASGAVAVSPAAQVTIAMSPTIDTDGDGVADAWEVGRIGGILNYGGSDDPDGDTVPNVAEYVADTHPLDSNQFLAAAILPGTDGAVSVEFDSRTGRLYRVEFSQELVTNAPAWSTATSGVAGTGASLMWTDDGTGTPAHPLQTSNRTYRLQVELP